MYILISKTGPFLICIVFLLFLTRVTQVQTQFVLSTLLITQNPQSFTVPYNNTFLTAPTNFAYFIESGTLNTAQFYLKHDATATSVGLSEITIKFILEGVVSITAPQILQARIMLSAFSSSLITLTMLTTPPLTPATLALPITYNPAALIKDLEVKVFLLNIPMTQTHTLNSTHLTVIPGRAPSATITQTSFSVLIITRRFVSDRVGLIIDNIKIDSLGWVIIFSNETFFDPSDNTMLVGITNYAATSVPIFDLQDGADFNFSFPLVPDQRSIFVYYDVDSLPTPTAMDVSIFLFSPNFIGCGGGFLAYSELYYEPPLHCILCYFTCKTCTSSNYSLSVTDENTCLSCGELKYLEETSIGSGVGSCKCYPGLNVDNVTQSCYPCTSNCLGFTIDFMRSSTQSEFLLKFSSQADLLIPMSQNLKIYINSTTSASFSVQQIKTNFYQIIVPPSDMTACNTKCLIVFEFSTPWKVLKKGRNQALTEISQSLVVENYYVVGDKIPQELNQAFTVSSMLVGAAAGGGLSSMLKMLFEIEQMIEFHKYLNIEMPLIFKEFIESLSIFKFLDIMTVFPFDIDAILQNLSTPDFNTKGPVKAVYYESGANFYKNIISVVVSFGVVLAINFTLFLVMRLIPCTLLWKFSQKLRVRALITFCDLVQTMIIPIIVFAHFQFSVVYYRKDIIWIYAMAAGMVFLILFIPFFVIAWVFKNKSNKEMKEVYEDLLNDCQLHRPATYAFFIVGHYRKIIFSISLLQYIPGLVQGFWVLTVNAIYLGFLLYIVSQKIFNSKLKMLTKTLNVLCVMGIQAIMIYYNFKQHDIGTMLDLGASCVYLAIISTITGVFEAFIKIFEVICQNVKDIQSDRQVSVQEVLKSLNKLHRKESKLDKALKTPITSNIGSDQTFIPFNSKDTLQTASIESKEKSKIPALNRAKKKLGFLASLNKKSQDRNNEQKNVAVEESFEEMMKKIDGGNFVSLDSTDQLGYGLRKKENIKNRLGQKKTTLQNKLSFNPQISEEEQSQGKPEKLNSLYQNDPKPKNFKNIDEEIQAYQKRRRERIENKKKEPPQRRGYEPEETQGQPNNQNRLRRVNTINEPTTERVKHEEKDEKMMENINERKTARRRTSSKKFDSLEIKNSNKKKNPRQDFDDDIYFPQ